LKNAIYGKRSFLLNKERRKPMSLLLEVLGQHGCVVAVVVTFLFGRWVGKIETEMKQVKENLKKRRNL
jgi:hypothetical protein